MPVVPSPNDREFQAVPQGNHVAVCYRVIDLGTQRSEYLGQVKHQHKILISWEIPDEKMDDGRPFTIGQRFTWSMSEKASLRKILESWRGKAFAEADFGDGGFDIKNIVGIGCMLNVVHATKGGKTYANIASVAKLPKGMKAQSPTNQESYVWLSREEFSKPQFEKLTDALKGIIMQSPEYRSLNDTEHTVRDAEDPPPPNGADDYGFIDDEIPF